MADRALFIGFGAPVRGREERAVEVFNEFVDMFARMRSDGRVASMEVSLLDPHGGDLGGFFMVHGSEAQCANTLLHHDNLSESKDSLGGWRNQKPWPKVSWKCWVSSPGFEFSGKA